MHRHKMIINHLQKKKRKTNEGFHCASVKCNSLGQKVKRKKNCINCYQQKCKLYANFWMSPHARYLIRIKIIKYTASAIDLFMELKMYKCKKLLGWSSWCYLPVSFGDEHFRSALWWLFPSALHFVLFSLQYFSICRIAYLINYVTHLRYFYHILPKTFKFFFRDGISFGLLFHSFHKSLLLSAF